MGYALWCDHGEHAFSSTERHHTMTVVSIDGDDDRMTERKTVCAKHMEVVKRSMLPAGTTE